MVTCLKIIFNTYFQMTFALWLDYLIHWINIFFSLYNCTNLKFPLLKHKEKKRKRMSEAGAEADRQRGSQLQAPAPVSRFPFHGQFIYIWIDSSFIYVSLHKFDLACSTFLPSSVRHHFLATNTLAKPLVSMFLFMIGTQLLKQAEPRKDKQIEIESRSAEYASNKLGITVFMDRISQQVLCLINCWRGR